MIYESDGLEVYLHKGNSPYMLVTFNNFATLADGKKFWGEPFVRSLNLNCISFMQKQRSWFPKSEMTMAIKEVQYYLENFKFIITYGNSMGAYAALKYARLLKASHVFAFNPQSSIDPIDVPFENRFNNYFDPVINAGMKICSSDFPVLSYVFFDPLRYDDCAHAQILGSLGAQLVPVTYTDHMTIRMMNSIRTAELFNFAVNDIKFPYTKIIKWKKDIPLYRVYLAIAAVKNGHKSFGERILAGLSRDVNNDKVIMLEISRTLSASGMGVYCGFFSER